MLQHRTKKLIKNRKVTKLKKSNSDKTQKSKFCEAQHLQLREKKIITQNVTTLTTQVVEKFKDLS